MLFEKNNYFQTNYDEFYLFNVPYRLRLLLVLCPKYKFLRYSFVKYPINHLEAYIKLFLRNKSQFKKYPLINYNKKLKNISNDSNIFFDQSN